MALCRRLLLFSTCANLVLKPCCHRAPSSANFLPCRRSGATTPARTCRSFSSHSDARSGFGAAFRPGSEGSRGFRRGGLFLFQSIGSGLGFDDVVRVAFGRSSAMRSSSGDAGAAPAAKPRRFALLTTGHAAEYCVETYGGYGPMFVTMLSDPGEEWDEYFVVEGQFPSQDELRKYDGFVVTGSRHDAHGDEDWIAKLCGVLQQLHEMQKKSLCVCFGHQVLSRALGGKTGRASVGWEVGLRDLSLTEAFFSKPYAVGMPPKLKVLEVHRDQVSEIPPGAELLASSERTGVEMFAMGEHALAIQGHPEFFEDVVVDLLEGRLAAMMTEEEIKLSKESLHKACADQKAWQQLCKEFLKGEAKATTS